MMTIFRRPPIESIPRFEDKWSPIYLEHGIIHVDDASIKFVSPDSLIYRIPSASLSAILVGPGTSITHEAIKICAESNAVLCWVGEDSMKYYSCGYNPTHDAKNIDLQLSKVYDKKLKLSIARKIFAKRYGDDIDTSRMTIKGMMGLEGIRVRNLYKEYGQKFSVPWMGRNYDRDNFDLCDNINKALNISNHALYAYCLSCIHCMGFSPFGGFFHNGNHMSFVFDLADIWKEKTSILSAFKICANMSCPRREDILEALKQTIEDENLNEEIPKFLNALFK